MTTKQTTRKRPASTLVHVETDRTPRRVAFWNRRTGYIQSDRGPGGRLSGIETPLSVVLSLITGMKPDDRTRVVYIIGGEHVDSEPATAWWAEPMAHGWGYDGYEMSATTSDRGHLNAGTYEREGVTVDVRMSARWFPGCDDPCVCVQAWNHLQTRLRATFGAGAALLATPAATGLDLLARSLPRAPHGHAPIEWPAAPEALQRVLYGNVGQGRMQWCAALDQLGRTVEQVYSLDGRWMYASCVSNLPVGTPTHTEYPRGADAQEAYLSYVPAWYRVTSWVPQEWGHIGLIPTREDRDTATSWPDTPGRCIEDAWLSGAELAVALSAGWPVVIWERWAYPDYQHTPGSNPAGEWAKRLRQLRSASQPAAYGDAAEPMAGALRHLLIDTVGMWHRREGERLRITPIAEQRPEGARIHHLDRKRGYVAWYEPVPLSRWATPWQRPEWSATVWGKSRAKLHTAALRLPRRSIIDLRNDAIQLTEQPPASCWPDDGQPGTFRVKETLAGPFTLTARGLVKKAKGNA